MYSALRLGGALLLALLQMYRLVRKNLDDHVYRTFNFKHHRVHLSDVCTR